VYLGIEAMGGRWGDWVDVIIFDFAPVVGGLLFFRLFGRIFVVVA